MGRPRSGRRRVAHFSPRATLEHVRARTPPREAHAGVHGSRPRARRVRRVAPRRREGCHRQSSRSRDADFERPHTRFGERAPRLGQGRRARRDRLFVRAQRRAQCGRREADRTPVARLEDRRQVRRLRGQVRNENHPHVFVRTMIASKARAGMTARGSRRARFTASSARRRARPVASSASAGVISRPVPITDPSRAPPARLAAPPPAKGIARRDCRGGKTPSARTGNFPFPEGNRAGLPTVFFSPLCGDDGLSRARVLRLV